MWKTKQTLHLLWFTLMWLQKLVFCKNTLNIFLKIPKEFSTTLLPKDNYQLYKTSSTI
jgi:hypothetical protein